MGLLPKNDQAEQAIVASLVENPAYCRAAVIALPLEDMINEIARGIVEAYLEGGSSDKIALATRTAELLGEAPPRVLAYINEAQEVPYEYQNIETYTDLVRDNAGKRRLVRLLNEGLSKLIEGERAANVVPWIDGRLKSELRSKPAVTMDDLVARSEQKAYEYHEHPLPPGQVRGLSTGLIDLDYLLGGLEPALYIVGARPSVGKTALMLKVTMAVAAQLIGTDTVAIYDTNEMTGEQLLSRAACADAKVKRDELRGGRLKPDDLRRYFESLNKFRDYPLELTYATHINDILARAYALPKPGVLVVDYLNKLSGGVGENRNQKFGSIASMLFDVASELQIPVFLLAQLRRSDKNYAKRLPQMDDLRDSGELEAFADVILMLHRETDADNDDWDPHALMVLKRKDRLGGGQHETTTLLLDIFGGVSCVQRGGYS